MGFTLMFWFPGLNQRYGAAQHVAVAADDAVDDCLHVGVVASGQGYCIAHAQEFKF